MSDNITSDSVRAIWRALEGVKDPEIPAVSVVEMGIIDAVAVDGGVARVVMIPTFSGCPAIDMMRADVEDAVRAAGFAPAVEIARKPWSTDRLSESARGKMRSIGLAPPHQHGGDVLHEIRLPVACPWCGSADTALESPFGPTLCRAIWYCNACRQSFERFKPL